MAYIGIKPSNSPLTSELIPDGLIATSDIANAAVTPAKLSQPLTLGTAVASTSGTSIDFTGIPSWAKRITVMFNGVSTNGTSRKLIQIGSGSFSTSGYVSSSTLIQGGTAGTASATNGFLILQDLAQDFIYGTVVISNFNANTWLATHTIYSDSTVDYNIFGAGLISLGGALDRIRITTANGTDAFDSGSINIMYEG
jgi:hypothetical protein